MPRLNPNEKNYLSLKAKDNALFNIRSKIPAFVLNPLNAMPNFVIDIIYLTQLEYEMDCADLSDDHFFKNRILWSPFFPYAHIQLEQALN